MIPDEMLDFLIGNEGLARWMYQDGGTPPVVTAGVGHALFSEASVVALVWDGPMEQAREDYRAVLAAPRGYTAGFYEQFSTSRLTEEFARELLERDLADRLATMKRYLASADYEGFPQAARTALADMAFNLGGGWPHLWPQLSAAVKAGDWKAAAGLCHRRGVSDERNGKTRDLFLTAAESA